MNIKRRRSRGAWINEYRVAAEVIAFVCCIGVLILMAHIVFMPQACGEYIKGLLTW